MNDDKGFPKRITDIRKCGCEYISERDPVVRKGYEMGGYLWRACPLHRTPSPRLPVNRGDIGQ